MTEQVNMTQFRFILENVSETEAVQRIRALQEKDLRSPSMFSLDVDLTVAILLELYRTFVSFELRGIAWESLVIYFHRNMDFNTLLLADVMRVANRASLFEEIYADGADQLPENLRIFPSLEKNHRLKLLELTPLNLRADDIRSLSCALRQSTCLEYIAIESDNVDTQGIQDTLSEALANNSTLIDATFHFEESSHLVRGLIGHPTLQNLTVVDADVSIDYRLEALPGLLSSDICRLESLALCHPGLVDKVWTENLLVGLKNNKSLKTFQSDTVFSGDRPVSRLMGVWKTHPTLQDVQLDQDITIEDIEEVRRGPRFPRRVFFTNAFEKQESHEYNEALKDLLDSHPEICWTDFGAITAESVEFACYLNYAGRYLMHQDIPPALWALVLARTGAQDNFRYKHIRNKFWESAVYEFLHGQALAGRL